MIRSDLDERVAAILEGVSLSLRKAGVRQAEIRIVYTDVPQLDDLFPNPISPSGQLASFDAEYGGWKSLVARVSSFRSKLIRKCFEEGILERVDPSFEKPGVHQCLDDDVIYTLCRSSSGLNGVLDMTEDFLLDQLTVLTGSVQYGQAREQMLTEKKVLTRLLDQLPVENDSIRRWLQAQLDDVDDSLFGSSS